METGVSLYKAFIDELVKMSQSCVDATRVEKGEVHGSAAKSGINDVLEKLSEEERKILAQYILETYTAGIYDTLDKMEWLRECRSMVISIENEVLPAGKFEGMPCDYIGRKNGWEWPE